MSKPSQNFTDAMMVMELVGALIIADGWESIDHCMQCAPDQLRRYEKMAAAALGKLREINQRPPQEIDSPSAAPIPSNQA